MREYDPEQYFKKIAGEDLFVRDVVLTVRVTVVRLGILVASRPQ